VSRCVEWGETDAASIVFYPNYFRWFDAATHDLFRRLGYPIARMIQEGRAVPIIDAGARFLAPLAYGDAITICSRIAEVRTRSFRVEHRIERDSTIVCLGFEVRIWVQAPKSGESLTAMALPDDVRELLRNALLGTTPGRRG
jgi:acyl-CoA thioester hydrolase